MYDSGQQYGEGQSSKPDASKAKRKTETPGSKEIKGRKPFQSSNFSCG